MGSRHRQLTSKLSACERCFSARQLYFTATASAGMFTVSFANALPISVGDAYL